MIKRPVQYLTLILMSLLFTACGAHSTLDSNNESVNLGLNTFEAYRALDSDSGIKCNDLANNYSEVAVGWYASRRAVGDGLPLKAVGDGLPSYAARRAVGDGLPAVGDGLPSRKAVGDGLPSFMYSKSVMMVEESGDVKYQEDINCANFVLDMEVVVKSGADSVLVLAGDKTVSVNVEEGVAKINIALEDLKLTEVQVQDSISGDILGVVFEGE